MKNLTREIETIKKDQMEIWELKCVITEIRNYFDMFNSLKMTKEWIWRSIEITHSQKHGEKRLGENNEQSLRNCGAITKSLAFMSLELTQKERRKRSLCSHSLDLSSQGAVAAAPSVFLFSSRREQTVVSMSAFWAPNTVWCTWWAINMTMLLPK